MNLIPLPALKDNYIWMLHDDKRALVVDPGESQVVLAALQRLGLQLQAILVTHHHQDHSAGVAALQQTSGALVFGPHSKLLSQPMTRLCQGQNVSLMGLNFAVIEVPGHTTDHIAFYVEPSGQPPLLFCGDTLFSGSCGRLFEGTPAQMFDSLAKLAGLPDATRVCCGHEYTASSLVFARQVEPDNQTLLNYQNQVAAWRAQNLPSLPSSIGLEKSINPFLRTHVSDVIDAVQRFDYQAQDPVSIFAALRTWKNQF